MVLTTVVLITSRSCTDTGTGHRHGYWSQTGVTVVLATKSGTDHKQGYWSCTDKGTGHRHGYWSQTGVTMVLATESGTDHKHGYWSQTQVLVTNVVAGVLAIGMVTGHIQG